MLAAAEEDAAAWSPVGETCTAFTGELVQILRNGISPGPPRQEFLSLNAIYREVNRLMGKKHRPRPQCYDPDDIGELPHFHNFAPEKRPWIGQYLPREKGPGAGPNESPRKFNLPNLPYRAILTTAVLVALITFLAIWLPGRLSEKTIAVGGVSLTEYCSSLNSPPGGADYCTPPVNLDAACNWQYHRSNLHHQIIANNPYSATCNTKTGQQVGNGITNMSGYCQSATGATDATATVNSKGEWVCQVKVDMNIACSFDYKKDGLVARQDASGNWICYE